MSTELRGRTDDELVVAIALSQDSPEQIARRFGLSQAEVSDIAAGRIRPELKARIDQVAQGYLARARRLGCRHAGDAMDTLAQLALADGEEVSAETRRRAAHDLLKYAFSEGSSGGGTTGGDTPSPAGLSHEQLERLAKANGGPRE